jgi:L-ascorbate metabolism protein UlaG (beta-lactamase superfamily)
MKITQIRNATVVIKSGDNVILVDPMLATKGSIPSLKYFTKSKRRNPLVELPDQTDEFLKTVTHCLITHCQKGHFDHLDRAATKWLRENNIPVYCSQQDFDFLSKKGLDITALDINDKNNFLNGTVSLVPCLHGKGAIGKLMAHGYGYFIEFPNEPTLYISGDTILTSTVKNFVQTIQPDISLIPAGGARFDLGGDIIMGLEESIEFGEISKGKIIANHLESLDHCPVSRKEIRSEIKNRSWKNRFYTPDDGETLEFS